MRTEYLTAGEVQRLLELLTPENRVVMRVCLHTGLRLSDVLSLKTAQLKSSFWVKEQKTGKSKKVGLPAALLADVQRGAGEIWAFPGRDPQKHRTRQAVWSDVKRAAAALGLRQNVAPHSARKVYAVDLMAKSGDLSKVRRALNHSSDSVTMGYALADLQLSAKYRRRAGRGRKKS